MSIPGGSERYFHYDEKYIQSVSERRKIADKKKEVGSERERKQFMNARFIELLKKQSMSEMCVFMEHFMMTILIL